MPAAPPKENGWESSSPAPSQSSGTDQNSPRGGGGGWGGSSSSAPEEGPAMKDENKTDRVRVQKGQTGNSCHDPRDRGKKRRKKKDH